MLNSPISIADIEAARERLKPYLTPTPLREYPLLNDLVGHGIRVWVKHENHQPAQSFKIRNGLASITGLSPEERKRGVIGASTGNHGQGVAWAGKMLGVRVTICVPEKNNPEKNAAIRALGAELIETGRVYDETAIACDRIRAARGLTLIHSTNHKNVIAGAGTLALEIVEQEPSLDALVMALGGGSQTVGALIVAAAKKPSLKVYAVGAKGAPAQFESWSQGKRLTGRPVNTFAEGVATGSAYEMTFDTLKAGLAGFVQVSDDDLFAAIRDYLRITHNLAEGAGAIGLAGLKALAPELAGKRVGVVISGGNLSYSNLARVLANT